MGSAAFTQTRRRAQLNSGVFPDVIYVVYVDRGRLVSRGASRRGRQGTQVATFSRYRRSWVGVPRGWRSRDTRRLRPA